jgi:hypothetical protein
MYKRHTFVQNPITTIINSFSPYNSRNPFLRHIVPGDTNSGTIGRSQKITAQLDDARKILLKCNDEKNPYKIMGLLKDADEALCGIPSSLLGDSDVLKIKSSISEKYSENRGTILEDVRELIFKSRALKSKNDVETALSIADDCLRMLNKVNNKDTDSVLLYGIVHYESIYPQLGETYSDLLGKKSDALVLVSSHLDFLKGELKKAMENKILKVQQEKQINVPFISEPFPLLKRAKEKLEWIIENKEKYPTTEQCLAETHLYLGRIDLGGGELHGAKEHFSKAISIVEGIQEPDFMAKFTMAEAYRELGSVHILNSEAGAMLGESISKASGGILSELANGLPDVGDLGQCLQTLAKNDNNISSFLGHILMSKFLSDAGERKWIENRIEAVGSLGRAEHIYQELQKSGKHTDHLGALISHVDLLFEFFSSIPSNNPGMN